MYRVSAGFTKSNLKLFKTFTNEIQDLQYIATNKKHTKGMQSQNDLKVNTFFKLNIVVYSAEHRLDALLN